MSLAITASGATAALPLLTGTGPDAPVPGGGSGTAWCSSADPALNHGNGCLDGLTFALSVWKPAGAGDPHPAGATTRVSKEQRITVSVNAAPQLGGGPQRPSSTQSSYRVAPGDTLSGIAADHAVKGGWPRLYALNREVVGPDPDLILPGRQLALPGRADRPGTSRPGRQAEVGPGRKTEGKADQPRKHRASAPSHDSRPAPQTKADRSQPERRAAKPPGTRYTAPVSAPLGTPYGKAGSAWSSGYHTGVDFPVPVGTSVKSIGPGTVVEAGWGGAYGYQVVVRHPDGRYSQYAHLSSVTVRVGQQVTGGRQVGRAGSTGNSSGPHLHLEIRTGPGYGSDIDPLAYLRAKGADI